jgi:hypothetical protein
VAIVDASATLTGSSVFAADGVRVQSASAVDVGASSYVASGGGIYLASANFLGSSTFEYDYQVEAEATDNGFSTFTADGVRVLTATAIDHGFSTFAEFGAFFEGSSSFVVTLAEVVRESRLFLEEDNKLTFAWNHLFQRGDLGIFLRDHLGPTHPVSISYVMFYVRPDGSRVQAGPSNRFPARCHRLGAFYVTGRAGEFGQPGDWIVRWSFQKTFYAPIQVEEQSFRVEDAVLAQDPNDVTERVTKYDWS